MRNSGQYSIDWFYKYYKEKGGKDVDIQTFHSLFNMGNLQMVLEKIDKEYGLTSLYNKDNKLIKTWQ